MFVSNSLSVVVVWSPTVYLLWLSGLQQSIFCGCLVSKSIFCDSLVSQSIFCDFLVSLSIFCDCLVSHSPPDVVVYSSFSPTRSGCLVSLSLPVAGSSHMIARITASDDDVDYIIVGGRLLS